MVLRQPFGGLGKSSFGPGVKAGGPNYVSTLMHFVETDKPHADEAIHNQYLADLCAAMRAARDAAPPTNNLECDALECALAATASYDHWVRHEFGAEHDHFRLLGQDNLRRYRAIHRLRIRIHADDTPFDLLGRVCAAQAVRCAITISSNPDETTPPMLERLKCWTADWEQLNWMEETDDELAEAIGAGAIDRLRYAAPNRVPEAVRRAAIEPGLYIADTPVHMRGRLELTAYYEEQSVCVNYHRHGNLGARSDEKRTALL